MEPGQEISVEIERGKTLVVRLLTSARPTRKARSGLLRAQRPAAHHQGAQPQAGRQGGQPPQGPTRATTPTWPRRCRAQVTIAVKPGQEIKAGDDRHRGDEDGDGPRHAPATAW